MVRFCPAERVSLGCWDLYLLPYRDLPTAFDDQFTPRIPTPTPDRTPERESHAALFHAFANPSRLDGRRASAYFWSKVLGSRVCSRVSVVLPVNVCVIIVHLAFALCSPILSQNLMWPGYLHKAHHPRVQQAFCPHNLRLRSKNHCSTKATPSIQTTNNKLLPTTELI
jgi:hypothetical protein